MSSFKPAYGLAAIAVLSLLIAAPCGGGKGAPTTTVPSATPTALATPTPTPTVAPEVIDGVEVVPLQFGEEAELPDDVALIVETGCYYCDGPATGLYRVYRDVSGQLRTDALFTVEALGLPPLGVNTSKEGTWVDEPYITGLALNDDASEIVAGVCTRGYCGGLGFPTADAQSTMYRSLDGGVTWEEFGVLDGESWVVAVVKAGVVVAGPYKENAQPKYRLFPSDDPVVPPPGASGWPLTVPNGDLAWRTDDGRLLRSDGSQVLALGDDASLGDIVPDASGERFAVAWWTNGPSPQHRVGLFSSDGHPISAFSLSDSVRVRGWLNDKLVAGNVSVPWELLPTPEPDSYAITFLPAVFDVEAGIAHPLAGPFQELPLFGRNYIQAALHGPFARVVNTGACLNVRSEPGTAVPVLACAADGVLLRDTGETRDADGGTWIRVLTPAGVEGWASTQYLER